MLDPCLESTSLLNNVKEKSSCRYFQKKSSTIAKEKVDQSEKGAHNEEVKKGTNILNNMEDTVQMICRWINFRGSIQDQQVG